MNILIWKLLSTVDKKHIWWLSFILVVTCHFYGIIGIVFGMVNGYSRTE